MAPEPPPNTGWVTTELAETLTVDPFRRRFCPVATLRSSHLDRSSTSSGRVDA